MKTENELKQIVKEKYGQIAKDNGGCGCSCGCGPTENAVDFSIMKDDYSNVQGYVKEADLNLGCGLPTEYAGIKIGNTVVDLGSGAGNDVFIARSIVGETGKVIGIDMTEEMLEKANRNNRKLGYKNIEFKLGDIENMPIEDQFVDVVVSNCVLNLVPNKEKAFAEIYRILKSGAHFCVSDIVIKGKMTPELQKSAELYAGCVSGAIEEEEYLQIIKNAGFKNVEIKKSKKVELPEEVLKLYLSEEGLKEYHENLKGIVSLTVVGYK
jgi:ubiquinone/menaquinone biosynthesis C-methylase UbiE